MKKLISHSLFFLFCISCSFMVRSQGWQGPVYTIGAYGSGAATGNFFETISVNGFPAIAFTDETHQNIMYVRALDSNGTNWGIPIIVDTFNISANAVSMAVVNGKPVIVYAGGGNSGYAQLRYRRANDVNGASWPAPVIVDSSSSVFSFSMLIVNGFPAIAYSNSTLRVLRFVRANDADGTTWAAPVRVDSSGYKCDYPVLKILNGKPAIGYFNATDEDLMFVRSLNVNGTSWATVDTVQSAGEVGNPLSMEIVNGRPAFAYYSSGSTEIDYIRALNAIGTEWGNPTVLDPFAGGLGLSLYIVNGFPAVTFASPAADGFYYMRATDITGTAWGNEILVGNPGQVFTSKNGLTVINGKPKITFRQFDPIGFYFQSAGDATGTIWNTPFQIQNQGAAGTNSSLKIVKGKAAISYYDVAHADLHFVRASDTTALSPWQLPVSVDATGGSGLGSKLEIVNGRPAIAYIISNPPAFKLMFVRAANATGSAWGTPLLLDSLSTLHTNVNFISLAIVNDTPSVSYYNPDLARLMFIRAHNINGTSWGAPVTVDSIDDTGRYNSLVEVNGCPAIAFYDFANKRLMYVRADNGSGTAWGTPLALTNTGDIGQYASMIIADGFPAIGTLSMGQMLYFRANDIDGTSWSGPITTGVGGVECQLAIANGKPVVAAVTSSILYYNSAVDNTGTTWGTPEQVHSGYGSSVSLTGDVSKSYLSYYNNPEATALYFSKTLGCTPPGATITTNGPVTFCAGDSVKLSAPVAANRSYQWEKGGISISGATTSSYTALTGGTYKVTVTNTLTGCTRTSPSGAIVTVNPLPNAQITPQGPTTFCNGDSVILKANSGAGLLYHWKKNGTVISGATNINYVANAAGVYKVKVTNVNGCTKISGGMPVTVPCRESEQERKEWADVSVFPNPSGSDFVISIGNGGDNQTTVEVFDVTGRIIFSEETTYSRITIGNQKLQPGVYEAMVSNGKNRNILKLVKTK